jgi:hypothetical protein
MLRCVVLQYRDIKGSLADRPHGQNCSRRHDPAASRGCSANTSTLKSLFSGVWRIIFILLQLQPRHILVYFSFRIKMLRLIKKTVAVEARFLIDWPEETIETGSN